MTWYQTLSLLEILFGTLFIVLYIGYLLRVRRVARFFQKRVYVVWVKFFIRSTYAVLLLISILGPSFGAMKKEIKTIGKDLYIAVDLSASMDATDIQPSRIEKAKQEILRVINRFNSDRIGLIIFSSEAFIQSPLTYDQNALQVYTRTLRTGLLEQGGTDYNTLLKLVSDKFSQDARLSNEEQKAKILILISDGEDFGENIERAAEALAEYNIRVYTVGIGTTEGSQIPTQQGFKKDPDGKIVVSRLHPDHLIRLAELTNGQYFEINNRVSEVNRLLNVINNIEGELRESKTIDVTANKYVYPLALALLLIVLDVLITIKLIRI
ncbi:VWA domain-containing protein [Pontibacter sp. SGAir0037]|uniref:VWA domain-containing protein n=1 Tax=Pontibacter sp. SGAir0037 TaxID=2571030 RepID=UPI0010CD4F98|nr:VWA domain-containing protein [Pontibacter sp. SGAir0037]QCR21327.1 aerotolerance regulator BatB [Pontibacter sp. SGAir0037]